MRHHARHGAGMSVPGITRAVRGWEEKAMAPHSSTFAWKIPWMEEPGRLQSMGSLGVGHDERLHFHFSLSCIGEGNGNPLQCSCLENPRDGGAWGLPSMGSHRVRHDWSDLAAAAARGWETPEAKKSVLVTQSCLTLCNPMDCSPPGPSVHAIFQARILE